MTETADQPFELQQFPFTMEERPPWSTESRFPWEEEESDEMPSEEQIDFPWLNEKNGS